MIKLKLIILIVFISLFNNFALEAQVKNNILFWGSGGYSSLMTNTQNIIPMGDVGFGLGAGYELHYNSFMLQMGAEFTYLNANLKLQDFSQDKDLIDIEGDPYVGHLNFTQNSDHYKLGNINIPLMAGAQFGNLYLLVGGKVGLNILGTSNVKTLVSTTATYPQFIDDFSNMPNHALTETNEEATYPVKLELNGSVSAEAGIYLGTSDIKAGKPRYRMSLFCDYGLLNVHDNTVNDDLILNKNVEISNYEPTMNSLMRSVSLQNSIVNTLFVGVKFTVELGLKEKVDCHCEPYQVFRTNKKTKRYK